MTVALPYSCGLWKDKLICRGDSFTSNTTEVNAHLQEEELAALLADRSYNELVSVLVDRLGDEAALQPKLSSDAYSQATRIAVEPKEARALQSPSEPTIVSSQGLTEEHAARLASDNAVIGLADTGSPSKTGKPSREQPATEASQIAALSAGVQVFCQHSSGSG